MPGCRQQCSLWLSASIKRRSELKALEHAIDQALPTVKDHVAGYGPDSVEKRQPQYL
jgi:hypothetical protein